MTNKDLDLAREWANKIYAQSPECQATVKVIQSLPDQLVDVEKLKAIIADMDYCLKMESTTDFSKGIDNATTSWRDALKALITPKPPTLADMTAEERETCRWMQAKTWSEVGIIVWVNEMTGFAQLITRANGVLERKFKDVAPLPGEPKLEWTAQEPHLDKDSLSGMWAVDGSSPADAIEFLLDKYEDHGLPRPEDVPAGEPWIVEHDGHKWVGAHDDSGTTNYPWALAKIDGTDYAFSQDVEVALVSRLVPEPEA